MKVTCLSENNFAVLSFERKSDTLGELLHSNGDDTYYHYTFTVEGTKEELDVVASFCAAVQRSPGRQGPADEAS